MNLHRYFYINYLCIINNKCINAIFFCFCISYQDLHLLNTVPTIVHRIMFDINWIFQQIKLKSLFYYYRKSLNKY